MFDKFFQKFRKKVSPEREDRPLEVRPNKPTLGLALSSGGARGLAHVGVLQVLEENGIEVHAISGSSMGAYVGALWAAGFSGVQLAELAAEMHDKKQLWKLADPVIPPMKGLFYGRKVKAHLERSLGGLCFEDLERQLLIITADLDTKERVVIQEGRLADAVHASCAMPGIIVPVMFEGRRCTDGGVVDPIPVSALRQFTDVDKVIAISVIPSFAEVNAGLYCDEEDPRPPTLPRRFFSSINRNLNFMAKGNIVDTFRQAIRCAQVRIAHDSLKRADLALRPKHFCAPWNDYSNFEQFIEEGRKVTLEHLDEIRALLEIKPNEKPDKKVVGEYVA